MRAYYINLDRRPDRRQQCETELLRVGLTPIRIPAVDGKLWDGTGWKKQGRAREAYWRGAAGCWFSHIRALETAVDANHFPCLVMEDDVEFRAPLPASMPIPVMRLGGNYVEGKGTYLLHSTYYESREVAQEFLDELRSNKNTTDSVMIRYQKLNPTKVGVISPYIAYQRQDYSDIEQRIMNRPHGEK